MKLTLAISTVSDNLNKALQVFDCFNEFTLSNVEFLVICQNDFGKDNFEQMGHVTVYYQSKKGLSKSRNYAIEKALGDYVWFLDDDVILKESFIVDFISDKFRGYDLVFGKIYCSDINEAYKKYSRKRYRRYEMLRVSSIEIIVRREFLINNEIYFDESLGLGARYPSGEENIFLLGCYDANASIIEIDEYCIYHPCNEEKREPKLLWAKPGYPYSKFNVARNLGGLLGLVYALRTCFRAIMAGVPLLDVVKFIKS